MCPAAAQRPGGVVEEDLIESPFDAEPTQGPADAASVDAAAVHANAVDIDALQTLLSEAEAVFHSIDRPASLSRFSQLIDLIEGLLIDRQIARDAAESRAADGSAAEVGVDTALPADPDVPTADDAGSEGEPVPPLPPEVEFLEEPLRDVLARSLGYRAWLYHEFAEDALVTQDLERMLTVDPAADLDPDQTPEDLTQAFDRLRKDQVGTLRVTVEPPDATATVDGRPVALPAPVGLGSEDPEEVAGTPALAGERWLHVERPGYAPTTLSVNIRGGRERSEDVVLERNAATLRLTTRPTDATVLIDGQVVATTSGQAPPEFVPGGSYRGEEFSAPLVVDAVELGLRRVEVRKDGYRPYRAELQITDLLDYPLPPIVLEEERGVLVFRDLPSDARITVDGREMTVDNPGASMPRLTLPPGEYSVAVSGGRASMFTTDLLLADRQTIEVKVRLRPGLAFLGVVGAPASTARDLGIGLARTFDNSTEWAFLDRSAEGPKILEEAGASAANLAAYLEAPGGDETIDWQQVQWSLDQRSPGLLYMAMVVSDTLIERRSTLLIWPAAPGPPTPDRIDMPVGDTAALARLRERFETPLTLRRPWVGATLIDSHAGAHPVVAVVTPGSPAEAAGLVPNDQIVAVAQVPVTSRAAFDARIAAAELGETLEIAVLGAGGGRNLRLEVTPAPAVLPAHDADRLVSVTFTRLGLMEPDAPATDRWLLRLDQALILLHARQWEEAARRLRDVDAPQSSHGFGQAAVDYWTGLALSQLGPDYRTAARDAFERAARLPYARLDHHDGPYLAPRAKARLSALGSGG